ncbi:38196_t:CDS:1, partial [Gigaspora margarita]
ALLLILENVFSICKTQSANEILDDLNSNTKNFIRKFITFYKNMRPSANYNIRKSYGFNIIRTNQKDFENEQIL